MTVRFLLLGLFLACTLFSPTAHGQWTLDDVTGRTWKNEMVTFPLEPSQLKVLEAGTPLVGPDGKATPTQILPGRDGKPSRIAFLAEVGPFQKVSYSFRKDAAAAVSDLQVEDGKDFIVLSNGLVGIRLRKRLEPGQAPIEALRTRKGEWVGGAALGTSLPVLAYQAEIVSQGPVIAEVRCEADFGEGRFWRIVFRLQAGEPAVLLDEDFKVDSKAKWMFQTGDGFPVTNTFFRIGSGAKTAEIATLDPKLIFKWVPWLPWWWGDSVGKWVGLFSEKNDEMLVIGARDSDVWVEPGVPGGPADRGPADRGPELCLEKGSIVVPLALDNGARRWLVGFLPRKDSLAALEVPKEDRWKEVPLPQQLVIKNEFPLDRVKDYVTRWEGQDPHPRLILTPKDVERVKASFQADPALLARIMANPIDHNNLDAAVRYFVGSGDESLGRRLAVMAVEQMQQAVDTFLVQQQYYSFGFGPSSHALSILPAFTLADLMMDSGFLMPEQRERLRSQAAVLGYTVMRKDYWSPERNFSGNANMTTSVAALQTAAGCFVPSHPASRSWVESGMKELKDNELDLWSDSKGGWLESPHYAMVSYDYLLGCFLMAKHVGFGDFVFDPKMKLVGNWMAKISTPPDFRLNGQRHLPPIGHTYHFEPGGEFGILAGIWREKDPEFASRMQWMWRQQGARLDPGVGGIFPSLLGFRSILMDPSITEAPPTYDSELFPKTGVVLRSHFPSDRETMLYLIAGENHDHYDFDSGSVTIWGKGRIIADDFGYYAHAPSSDHNMVETVPPTSAEPMRVTANHSGFVAGRWLDYVRGMNGPWMRQIAMVRDRDPLGPNFFVITDTIRGVESSTWRMWFSSEDIKLDDHGALVNGLGDVATDVKFLRPRPLLVKKEVLTHESPGLGDDGIFRIRPFTQVGLVAATNGATVYSVVLFPRLKSESPPVITSIAEGKGVRVQSAAGTDYVFLNGSPFSWQDGRMSFEGTVGSARIRGEKISLSLAAPGTLKMGDRVLQAAGPAEKEWP